MSMFTLTRRQCCQSVVSSRSYASASHGSSVFSDAKDADYVTSAVASSILPQIHGLPEIVVTGRSNVGKSTLLNAILGRKDLVLASRKPGRTKMLNFFRVGSDVGKLVVVDAPGYGARGRPEWGELFQNYLKTRAELRRVYILFNAKHGLNDADKFMLQDLDAQCQASGGTQWTLQAIITKADTVTKKDLPTQLPRLRQEIFASAPTCLPPIVTAAGIQPPFGTEETRKSIAEACDLLQVGALQRSS